MRLVKAFFYSLNGLKEAYCGEAAFRLEVYVFAIMFAVILCVALLFVSMAPIEYALLFLSYGIVMVSELLNTAIEKTIDRISLDQHLLSKKIKDIASAAVFVSVVVCSVVWLLILVPKFS